MCRFGSGAPFTNSTGMSVIDPLSEAGLLCAPLLCSSCRCPCFVSEGLSALYLLSNSLIVDTSLKEPDVPVRLDSGESASSLAKDRVLCRMEEDVFTIGHIPEICVCLYVACYIENHLLYQLPTACPRQCTVEFTIWTQSKQVTTALWRRGLGKHVITTTARQRTHSWQWQQLILRWTALCAAVVLCKSLLTAAQLLQVTFTVCVGKLQPASPQAKQTAHSTQKCLECALH